MKKVYFIAAINNLDINDSFDVGDGIQIFPPGKNPWLAKLELDIANKFIYWAGARLIDPLINKPTFSGEFLLNDVSSENRSHVTAQFSRRCNMYLMILGLVTDCSAYCSYAFMLYDDFEEITLDSNGVKQVSDMGEYQLFKASPEQLALAKAITDMSLKETNSPNTVSMDVSIPPAIQKRANDGSLINPLHIRDYSYSRVTRAIFFFNQARTSSMLPMRIAMFIITLECLFSVDDTTEVGHKVSERVASLLGNDKPSKKEIMKFVQSAYSVRSKFFHGQNVTYQKKKVAINSRDELIAMSQKIGKQAGEAIIHALNESDLFNDDTKLGEHLRDLLFS